MESELEYFLKNYFHQDFNEEFGGAVQAVDAFVAEEPELAAPVPDQIFELLRLRSSERELDAYLEELGCEYFAQPEDGGYRGWLTSVAAQIQNTTREQ